MFCNKKYHILTFCDRKYRNLTFCDKTEKYLTVVQQNNAEASLSHSLFISLTLSPCPPIFSHFLLFPLPRNPDPRFHQLMLHCHAKPINTMQCILKVDMTIQFSIHVIPYNTIQYHLIQWHSIQHHTIPCNRIPNNIILCNARWNHTLYFHK